MSRSLYNELTIEDIKELYRRIVEKWIPVEKPLGMNCIYVDLKYDKRPQIRYKRRKRYVSICSLLYKVKVLEGRTRFRLGKDEEADHFFCHDPECVDINHMVFSDQLVNKSRSACRLYGYEDGYKCPHEPKCNICEATRTFITPKTKESSSSEEYYTTEESSSYEYYTESSSSEYYTEDSMSIDE